MKFIAKASAALLSAGLLATVSADEPVKFNVPGVSTPASAPAAPAAKPAAPAAAPAATPAAGTKFTEAQLMEAYGFIFALESGLADQLQGQAQALEFTPEQRQAMLRGIGMALSGKDLPYDQAQGQQLQTQLAEFMKPKQEAFAAKRQAFINQMNQLRLKNLADGIEYFKKLKGSKGVTELPSGLCYEILKPGTGAVAKVGQVATVHYTGTLIDGKVFDSSLQPRTPGAPVQPVDLLVKVATQDSPGGIIPGMAEGLQKVGVGGKIKLHIPPSLAYGDQGNEVIPPGSTLIFEVEVINVKDAPSAPAAK